MGAREEEAAGGLDDLFGADKFREYDDSINPFVAPPPTAPVRVVTAAIQPDPTLAVPPLDDAPGPIHDRLSPTVAMPVVEESRGPVHDRLSATVAMPVVEGERGSAQDRLSRAVGAVDRVPVEGQPSSTADEAASEPASSQPSSRGFWARLGTRGRVLIGAGGGAALAVLLGGLYALGTALGGGQDAATADSAGAEASVAALEPGVHQWSALQGGECLDPLESVWAEEFTVVACDTPHAGQFMHRGEVGPEVTVYLDAEGWHGLTTTLCDAGDLLDLNAASAITDLQWQLTYAGDATEWANGDRSYGCFVSRSSGEPITGSLLAG